MRRLLIFFLFLFIASPLFAADQKRKKTSSNSFSPQGEKNEIEDENPLFIHSVQFLASVKPSEEIIRELEKKQMILGGFFLQNPTVHSILLSLKELYQN